MSDLRRILLVDDSAQDVELALAAFEENGLSDRVVVARDGQEALDYLYRSGKYADREEELPAVVLLDIKMPKIDGLEVLRRLKSDPDMQALPVVMLTSSREEVDLVESYNTGSNAYVVKPVDFNEFVESMKEIGIFWAMVNEPPYIQG